MIALCGADSVPGIRRKHTAQCLPGLICIVNVTGFGTPKKDTSGSSEVSPEAFSRGEKTHPRVQTGETAPQAGVLGCIQKDKEEEPAEPQLSSLTAVDQERNAPTVLYFWL